ncbi:ankyrin repeat domain-containing protein SOWAHA [Sphaeramia orbicularis]|uniref:Ankyrin repeat domain-containing protein SOWAHA-like n=1 Tax=Sphaeramia orbicularis TaxID=375764 RepID=A0A673AVU0_9TELE|nr:ankyrin repeat domain-containing protein SOWAHA-like [Sphaeramia orbicularis]
MDLSQQSVLTFLITEGGKVTKSDLVRKFKGSVDSDDPAEKDRNRELFKTFVNNVAVVKEIEGVRFVVIRKKYEPLLESFRAKGKCSEQTEKNQDECVAGEQQNLQGKSPPAGVPAAGGLQDQTDGKPSEGLSPIELALQRSNSDFKVKRMLNFEVQNQNTGGVDFSKGPKESTSVQNKPHALPLRMPPTATRVEITKLKGALDPESPTLDDFSMKKKALSLVKSTSRTSEESKESRVPSVVPLDQWEHEWLVKCAAGHWSQVYGLLLRDHQLADKKDFMSGFTALHWAAKCGNSDMVTKIIDISKQGGVDVDVNARTHGGYTPLHIAALHDQQYVLAMLVGEYGADPSIRDNCGKRAYHYLHKGMSQTIRDMLGEPRVQNQGQGLRTTPHEKEELDRELFLDLSKGLHTISRLFQPNMTGQKKKHKQRPAFYSMSDEQAEEREDAGGLRHRLVSDVFM